MALVYCNGRPYHILPQLVTISAQNEHGLGRSAAVSRIASIDLYGGLKPGDVPVHTVSEAAHYLRLPRATIRSWAIGRQYRTKTGEADFRPIIDVADRSGPLLSFNNLAELHVLGSIRRAHLVKLPAVRNAIDYLRKRFKSDYPLLSRQMMTDGKDLFMEHYGNLLNISQQGQLEMRAIMAAYLQRIKWDRADIPVQLFPFTRDRYTESPKIIAIDPKIRFGKPCITGTRIPTAMILQRHQAGDSIQLLAQDYSRNEAEIEEAIRYEGRIAS